MEITCDVTTARRKANRWLLEHVGVMFRADMPTFVRSATRPLWRFSAYMTAASRDPVGPAGYVEVDAVNGAVLADARTAEEIAARGERLEYDNFEKFTDAFQTMLASESVLWRDWDRPEEDEAWADL